MKRQLMEVTIFSEDFKHFGDAHDHGDPANDRDTANVFVDADIEPRDPSVGQMHATADVTEVLTRAGVDIWELLTQPALERLGERFLEWKAECAETTYETWVDFKIKQRKEEKV